MRDLICGGKIGPKTSAKIMQNCSFFCAQIKPYYRHEQSVNIYRGLVPTFQNTFTCKIHEAGETDTEDCILSPIQKSQTRCRLQCCFFVLGQQLVIALGLVLFICEVLATHKHSTDAFSK